jgi:hypothetical protein
MNFEYFATYYALIPFGPPNIEPFTMLILISLTLILVPFLIYQIQKNKTIKKNQNYEAALKQLKLKADEKIRDAIELNGIIPLSSNYPEQFKEGLYLDKNRNNIVLFGAEYMLFQNSSNKIPRPLNRIIDKINQSELLNLGWGFPLRDYAEDFVSRLAELDDALDFTISNDLETLENKIIFSHSMPFLEKDGEPFYEALNIYDGSVEIRPIDHNEDGTIALAMDSDVFFKEYGESGPISIGNLIFEV